MNSISQQGGLVELWRKFNFLKKEFDRSEINRIVLFQRIIYP